MISNFKKIIMSAVIILIVLGVLSSSVYGVFTCMQAFGRTCANGACLDFDYADDCKLHCYNRNGLSITVTCD